MQQHTSIITYPAAATGPAVPASLALRRLSSSSSTSAIAAYESACTRYLQQ
jgi:hypothetical protein